MKAVLMSTQPKWCEKITHVIGYKAGKPIYEKTIEVRKTKPKLEVPFKVYIYQTKESKKRFLDHRFNSAIQGTSHHSGMGKVIGEFVCDDIENFKEFEYGIDALHRHIKLNACIGYGEIYDYLGFAKCGYGWHISDLKIYDKPKELSEFRKYNPFFDGISTEELEAEGVSNVRIKRPPQSWCYIEKVE